MIEYTFYNAIGRTQEHFASKQQITCTAKIDIPREGKTLTEYEIALKLAADNIEAAMRATTSFDAGHGATVSGLRFVYATRDFRDHENPTVTGYFVPADGAFTMTWELE